MYMNTVEKFKDQIQQKADDLSVLENSLFTSSNKFVTVVSMTVDFGNWCNSIIHTSDGTHATFNEVYDTHCKLYFEKIKLLEKYDRDAVRKMYFALTSIKNMILDLKIVARVCDSLSTLGAIDGARKKLSAIGKYFVSGTPLTAKALTRFQNENRTNFRLNDFVEFRESYMMSYDVAKEAFEETKQLNSKNRRYAKDAVAKSYTGDITQLVEWIKDNLEYVEVKVPSIQLEDYEQFITGGTKKNSIQKSIAEVKEKVIESTEELILEAKELGLADSKYEVTEGIGFYSAWTIKLKSSCTSSMPTEVSDWTYLKKQFGTLDSYVDGLVFREKQHTITGNPIVKDLVFGYGIELKQK